MSKSYIDLHLHTLFSDGVSTPEEVAKEAHNKDLAAIALPDHDTTEGCQRQAKACAKSAPCRSGWTRSSCRSSPGRWTD